MRLPRALAALVLLLPVTACSDDAPPPKDPASSWSPTGTMETPTSAAPDPVEPELPGAATEASEAGARAFIAYYWELINYAQVTGDVKALKAVSASTCEGCNKGIAIVEDLYESGGHAEGGEYDLTIQDLKDVSPKDRSVFGIEARYEVRNAEQSITHGDGGHEAMTPATTEYLSYLIWLDGAWRTDVLEPR